MSHTQPSGFLALPPSGKGRPVLVLHAWWGLNDTIKGFCNRLAEAGFVAFALDLYRGKMTDQISEAEKLAPELDANINRARADIAAAIQFLKAVAGSDETGIAVIGFSLGAFYALDASANHSDVIRSVVFFYGTGPADFTQSKASYLAHYAGNDPYEPQENIDYITEALTSADRPFTIYQYSGTGHWFFEPDRVEAYNEAAAKLAWDRTLAFLRRPQPVN